MPKYNKFRKSDKEMLSLLFINGMYMGNILLKEIQIGNSRKDILIKGQRIARIEDSITIPKEEEQDYRVIDCNGKGAIPGFINMHTHSAMTLTRGYKEDTKLQEWLQYIWAVEAKMDHEAIYWGTKLACLEMIKTGTTCFYDQYWMPETAVKAVQEMGLRSVHAFVALNLKDESKSPAIQEGMAQMYEQSLSWGEMHKMSVGIHAPYTVSDNLIKWCTDFARKKGLTVHIHMSETEQEYIDSVKLNECSPFAHLENLGALGPETIAAHCVWISDDDITIMSKYGVTAVHNINSNLKLSSGSRFRYNELKEKGVRVCLGTDGCGSSNNLDMREAMKTAALLQKGWRRDPEALPLNELMDIATSNGADALGIDTGRLEVGKLADIAIIDMDNYAFVPNLNFHSNLVYSANSSCIESLICNGELIMENRVVKGEKEIIENARRVCKILYSEQI